ncbi:hypothetical protein B0H14DRAFT_3875284 [Mycena olivaceomarginata]|nr:hypothetical protein B0H14DRAFT_3875284 [Mycena olivaceomarginata]
MAVNLDPLLILCLCAFTSVLLILVPLLPQTSRFTGKTKGICASSPFLFFKSSSRSSARMVHHLEKTTHLKSAKVPIIVQPHQLRRWSELAILLDAPCTPRPHIPLDTWACASTGASGMTCPGMCLFFPVVLSDRLIYTQPSFRRQAALYSDTRS